MTQEEETRLEELERKADAAGCAVVAAEPVLRSKIAAKKKKLQSKLRAKLGKGKAGALAVLLALCIAGCQSADPSSRANRATYGDIKLVDCTNCTLTIGDGVLATADGGGDSNTNTPTQETNPSLTLPGDAIATGIAVAGNLVGKALDSSGKTGNTGNTGNSGITGTGVVNGTAVECTDGACIPVAPVAE